MSMINAERLPRPLLTALDPLRRERARRSLATDPLRNRFPATEQELRASPLLDAWWYYSVELLPGVVAEGQRPAEHPMLPRIMLRNCDVGGQSCLDVGTMEGLVPVLLKRRGAADVLAVDYSNHCLGKLAAVQHYHGVDYDYRSVGLLYELGKALKRRSFDLINLSGLLYHVYSPLTVMASVRSLLKRDGLLVASTYVTLDANPVMDFNARGRVWGEGNTFWFPSVALFDYLLRYLRLLPIDCAYLPESELRGPECVAVGRNPEADIGKPWGYLSVVCRAVDTIASDPWVHESRRSSWEYQGMTDWRAADARPRSSIRHAATETPGGIDLHAEALAREPVRWPAPLSDSHVLMLSASS